MKHWIASLFAVAVVVGTGFVPQAEAQTSQQRTELTKQIESINEILYANPAIVPGLLENLNEFLETKRKSEQAKQKYHQWLFNNDKAHPWVGSATPELTIVVFTDFDCPYCKRLDPHIQKIVKQFPDVKIVSVLVPLRQQNVRGSNVNPTEFGLNVWRTNPRRYRNIENYLYTQNGLHDANSLRQIAQRTNTESLLAVNREVRDNIAKNYRAFTELGFRGTPTIMIGEGAIPGFIEYEQFEEVVRAELEK